MKTIQTCNRCGSTWSNTFKIKCSNCGYWNVTETVEEAQGGKVKTLKSYTARPVQKITTGFWDYTFGGGLAISSVGMIGGPPGAGKSTLLFQLIYGYMTSPQLKRNPSTLSISSEEAGEDIKARAERLNILSMLDNHAFRVSAFPIRSEPLTNFLYFASTFDGINIESALEETDAGLVIVDSLQGLTRDEKDQLEICQILKANAVRNSRIIIITSQVNKDEDLAGLMATQHDVDATFGLYPDGEKRLFMAIKNRFGPTPNETYMRMGERGFSQITEEEWLAG